MKEKLKEIKFLLKDFIPVSSLTHFHNKRTKINNEDTI